MKSIKDNVENTLIINKSKFITKLFFINTIDEIDNILNDIKNNYKDSTHICYAYILDNYSKCYDDKEPNGTAGLPILNVLKKNNLEHILAVVIRYFGGIKLGVGGLTRAYSNSIIEALKLTNIINLKEAYLVEIEFSYDKNIIDKSFNDTITYKFYLDINELNFIPELEKVVIHVSIKDKTLVTLD